jgi:hypothetical protein
MLQRRRVTNRSSNNKKGLLEAFQQKVDIESKRAGLKNTGKSLSWSIEAISEQMIPHLT